MATSVPLVLFEQTWRLPFVHSLRFIFGFQCPFLFWDDLSPIQLLLQQAAPSPERQTGNHSSFSPSINHR
jgi:hypothetical protein